MDRFAIESTPGAGPPSRWRRTCRTEQAPSRRRSWRRISAELARHAPQGLLEELQQQNQELLNTLQELRDSQAEIAQMHSRELDETNRGVVALYAELDEGTKALQRLSDLKSRFLSEMSHEFRSPLNSIKGLTGFLLARSDGDLSAEQEKQVRFIRQAAEGLSTLVDDLLDLAKVEAGKAVIRVQLVRGRRPVREPSRERFGPMIDHEAVSLVFEEPTGIPTLNTDEGKVAQILRNFLTNAVKFTERGEIRVSAQPRAGRRGHLLGQGQRDRDRGRESESNLRGISARSRTRCRTGSKGIGLGLPLTRKLAQLLGGDCLGPRASPASVRRFSVAIPRVFRRDERHEAGFAVPPEIDRLAALVASSSAHDEH